MKLFLDCPHGSAVLFSCYMSRNWIQLQDLINPEPTDAGCLEGFGVVLFWGGSGSENFSPGAGWNDMKHETWIRIRIMGDLLD